ncbi:MAG: carbohydrate ABC transporter permease [bacterium]
MANRAHLALADQVQKPVARQMSWLTRKSMRQALGKLLLYIALTLLAATFIIPLVWMISTSFKSLEQQAAWPPVWIPNPIVWRNYPDAFNFLPLARYTFNTLVITTLSITGTLLVCPIVAYAFARIRFPGRDALFIVLIATIILPSAIRLIPTYLMFEKIGWLNTYLPLVVPSFFGTPFYIFLLRQYFRTFPEDLADAARVDGAGEFLILWRIFLPMSGPALAVITIFDFQNHWNDFFGPLIYLNKEEMRTLALGLYYFRAYQDTTNWGQMMAAATAMTMPVLILFALFQRYFIRGVALTGMKG